MQEQDSKNAAAPLSNCFVVPSHPSRAPFLLVAFHTTTLAVMCTVGAYCCMLVVKVVRFGKIHVFSVCVRRDVRVPVSQRLSDGRWFGFGLGKLLILRMFRGACVILCETHLNSLLACLQTKAGKGKQPANDRSVSLGRRGGSSLLQAPAATVSSGSKRPRSQEPVGP